MATRTIVQSGAWSSAATWGGVFPGEADFAVVPMGLMLEWDVIDVAVKRLIYEGECKLSRSVSSRIIFKGGLVSMGGMFDGGFFNERIPASVTHELVFDYSESGLVAGALPTPHPDPFLASSTIYDSDAGWWGIHHGMVFLHGMLIDPFSFLTVNAAAGGTTCSVDGRFTFNWLAGHELVFAATDMPASSNPIWRHEYRTLGTIAGAVGDASRAVTISGGTFANDHRQYSELWTDRFGQAWTEALQGEVANLTRNIIIRGARATDRPHVMFTDETSFYIDGVRFKDMGPLTKPNRGDAPMGRYPFHAHRELAMIQPVKGKTDSYLRRCAFDGDVAQDRNWAISIHETDGVEVSENVCVGMGTSVASGSNQQANAIVLEDTTPLNAPGANGRDGLYRSAEDCRLIHNLVIRSGHKDSPGLDNGGIWTGRGQSAESLAVLVDNYLSGHDGSTHTGALTWPQTNAAELTGVRDLTGRRIPLFGLTSHSHRVRGMKLRTNTLFRPVIDLVDIRGWRCRSGVDQHGAYASGWHIFGMRGWEWGAGPGFEHSTHSRLVTDWFLDGGNLDGGGPLSGVFAIGIGNYIASSVLAGEDSIYEMGIARDLNIWFAQHLGAGGSADFPMWIQFSRNDHGGFKILYGNVTFSPTQGAYGSHAQEGWPPFHDRSTAICGVIKGVGYGDYSITRVRNALAGTLPNTTDTSFDLRHVWDTLSPGSEPALPEDYGRSTRTSEIYPNAGSNAGAKKSNVAGTDLARELPPKIKWIAPAGARYSAEPALDGNGKRLITLTFETDATESVEIYEMTTNWLVEITTILKPAGPATWQGTFALYDMEQHPYRWAAFGAEATNSREAAVNTTNGSTTITAPAGSFKSADAGKRIMIEAAASGAGRLTTTIATFVSSSQVTLTVPAGNTVTGADAVINAHPTGGDRQIRTWGKDIRYVYKQLDPAAPPPPPPASGIALAIAD